MARTHPMFYTMPGVFVTLQLFLWCVMVIGTSSGDQHPPKVEAFFQGKCTSLSPCHQDCMDLPTGGYECSCWPGYTLHYNGFSCVPVEDYDMDDKNDVLDRLQKISDVKDGGAHDKLIYPVHKPVPGNTRSRITREMDDLSHEESLEQLAWDQFIRKKVEHQDLDDLDDLEFDLDDMILGDDPMGGSPPLGGLSMRTGGLNPVANIAESTEDNTESTTSTSASNDNDGDMNGNDDEVTVEDGEIGVDKRRRPKGQRNKNRGKGGRKKVKSGRRKNRPGNKSNRFRNQNRQHDDDRMMATNPDTSEEATNQLYEGGGPTASTIRYRSCDELRCQAGGRCVPDDMRGGYRCQCRLGNTGDFCERDLQVRYPKFMGNGYVAFPVLRGAYKEFSITIEFRPDTQNGLLLFSSEHPNARADFFSLALVDGYAQFRFDCGTGPAEITTNNMVLLNEWNTIRLYRTGWDGWVQLNDGDQANGRSKDLYSRITFRQDLYLGGYRNITLIGARTGMEWGFVGCVKNLEINGRSYDMRKGAFVGDAIHGVDVGECSAHVCDGVRCLNGGTCTADSADTHVCLCPLGTAGDRCENRIDIHVTSFQGSSYLQYIGLRRTVLSFTEIEIVFKSESPDGLIIYNGYTSDRSGDFISLGLVNGYLEYRFDLGTGPAIIRSEHPLSLHEWHVIRISRTGRNGYMQIDNQAAVEGNAKGAYTQLTLTLDLFIGGHRNFDEIAKNANLKTSFKGCIQKVVVNERPMRLIDEAIDGVNIDNCNHPCTGQPCMNGGRCIPIRDHYKCSCPIGFENTNCEDRKARRAIRTPIEVPMFSGDSFLLYTNPEIMEQIRGTKIQVSFRMRSTASDGVILWSGEERMTHRSDYVSIGMRDGYPHFAYNLGSGELVIPSVVKVNDGRWHSIRVERVGLTGFIEVDGNEIEELQSPKPLTQLNTEPKLYIGGMEDITVQTMRKYNTGFTGCITNFTLSGENHLDLISDSTYGQNISRCT